METTLKVDLPALLEMTDEELRIYIENTFCHALREEMKRCMDDVEHMILYGDSSEKPIGFVTSKQAKSKHVS
jgi:hypothetical protein